MTMPARRLRRSEGHQQASLFRSSRLRLRGALRFDLALSLHDDLGVVAQVDLVVPSSSAGSGVDKLMQPLNRWSFFSEGADVQYLTTKTFGEILQAQLVDTWNVLLPSDFDNGRFDHFLGHDWPRRRTCHQPTKALRAESRARHRSPARPVLPAQGATSGVLSRAISRADRRTRRVRGRRRSGSRTRPAPGK